MKQRTSQESKSVLISNLLAAMYLLLSDVSDVQTDTKTAIGCVYTSRVRTYTSAQFQKDGWKTNL